MTPSEIRAGATPFLISGLNVGVALANIPSNPVVATFCAGFAVLWWCIGTARWAVSEVRDAG